jgi:hypothetical protein
MRTYEMHPNDASFTAWSSPVAVSLPGGATNEFVVWKEGPVYHGIYVDFARNGAYIHATSSSLTSGWGGDVRLGFDSQEGGTVLKKPEGGYRFFCEPGNIGNPLATYRWCDFNTAFTSHTPQTNCSSTIGMRNGKMTALPSTTNYADWIPRRLAGRPAVDTAPDANPDGDEFPNSLEYALDLDPLAHDTARYKPSARLIFPGALAFTHRAVPSLSDTVYAVESGETPSALLVGESTVQSRTLMSDGTLEIVALDQPSVAAARRLMRLRATITP